MASLAFPLASPLGGDAVVSTVFPGGWPIGAFDGKGFELPGGNVIVGAYNGRGFALTGGSSTIGAYNGRGFALAGGSGAATIGTAGWPIGAINGKGL